jgi:hypothetical protein
MSQVNGNIKKSTSYTQKFSSSQISGACAWLSKRTAIDYSDLYLRRHEQDALSLLRNLLASGAASAASAAAKVGRTPILTRDNENEVDEAIILSNKLWEAVFSTDATTSSLWRETCVCPMSNKCPETSLANSIRSVVAQTNTSTTSTTTTSTTTSSLSTLTLLIPLPELPSHAWVSLGFQGHDPRTDLRALGSSGLSLMLRLFDKNPSLSSMSGNSNNRWDRSTDTNNSDDEPFLNNPAFGASSLPVSYHDRILRLAIGCARGTELPFAIAALNAQYMLLCHLRLYPSPTGAPPVMCCCCGSKIRELEYGSRSTQSFRGASLRGFVQLLGTEGPDAFFHLYAITLLMLAKEWRQASYSDKPLPGEGGGQGGGGEGREDGKKERNSFTTGQLVCFDQNHGGIHVGDARLLQFPSMLSRVRQRVMGALAGCIEEDDFSEPSSHSHETYNTPKGRSRSRSFFASPIKTRSPPSISSLSEILLV